ncbi:Gfo/Idh/MocA family oxidoreductase [soil metagenome]
MKDSTTTRRKFIKRIAQVSVFTIVPRFVLGGSGHIAPSDLINLGFIGCGRQAGSLRNSFHTTGMVQVVAASEVYGDKGRLFVEKANAVYAEKSATASYNGVKMMEDFRELLAMKEIDAVVIATPDHWHGVMAIKALKAGKDVYCEKPLSLTIAEGRAMVKATRENKRVFQTGNMQRSWPEFRQAVELIRNGYIGDIKTVKVNVGGPPIPYTLPAETIPAGVNWDLWIGPNAMSNFNSELAPLPQTDVWAHWRSYKEFGGGGMTDWGAHMFDIAQWALDKDDSGPVKITPPNGKDVQFLTYLYKNGITMTHENFEINNAVRFIGTEGQLDIQRGKLETSPNLTLKDKVIGAGEKHVYFSDNHYADFLKAIKNRTRPISDVEVGHRTASVCTLGNIAYELKRSLDWNPKKEKFLKDDVANGMLSRNLKGEWNVL